MNVRNDFPILKRKVNGKQLIYLDSAATSQKPKQVLDKIKEYYENYNANIHRSISTLAEEATEAYEKAHEKVAKFINAENEEIIFTKNATEGINLAAYGLFRSFLIKPGDEIILTEMEHHSNLVPWQQIAKEVGVKVSFIKITKDGLLDLNNFKAKLNKKVKLVAFTHVSNVLGTVNPVEEIIKLAKKNGSYVLVDSAQGVPHIKIDVKKWNADFVAFSGHKMLAPTGIGVLFGKKELLDKMKPFMYGGGMISEVSYQDSKWNEIPHKFEAGTPNIEGGIALGYAVDYLENIGMDKLKEHCDELVDYALCQLRKMKNVEIYGPNSDKRAGLIAFNVKGVHAHDLSTLLDKDGIAIRAGHHCVMPLHNLLGITSTARISFYIYNTKEEVNKFIESLKKTMKFFGVEY